MAELISSNALSTNISNSSSSSSSSSDPLVNLNPLMVTLYSDEFPDILQNYSNESCRAIFDLLIDCPATLVNKVGPLGGYTALHWMAIKNELDLIEFLIKKCQADVDCVAKLGETPLLISIKNNNIYTADMLINLGADLKHRDVYNRSILHWSAYSGRVIWFYYFQRHHEIANFNDVDQFLQNPLHIACASGFSDLAKFLIDTGDLDLFSQDINGNNIMHMAARAGMLRTCWIISNKNRGECIKLASIQNKQLLRPFDMIRNEKGMNHCKLKNWLRIEEKTNPILLSANTSINLSSSSNKVTLLKDEKDKKNTNETTQIADNYNGFTVIEKIEINLKLSSYEQGYAEWFFRLILPFLILTVPVLINKFLIPYENSMLRGLIGFGSIPFLLWVFTKQTHRISHISGFENSYYLGFFVAGIFHNYLTFYLYIVQSFNITCLIAMLLTCLHIYSLYTLLNIDPGVPRESIKRGDGTSYTLKDLLKSNYKKKTTTTKDSVFWLTEPINKNLVASPYFCDTCISIQATPTKHCKLCEGCCTKFDHHCLFINKCVGLRNHRQFIYLVFLSLFAFLFYLYHLYFYLMDYADILELKMKIPLEEQGNLVYYALTNSTFNWLFVLIFIDSFGITMVTILLYFQFKFISLGYTQQFAQSALFTKVSQNMQTYPRAILHRLDNLYIFFFQGYDQNLELFYKQENLYRDATKLGKTAAIPLDHPDYPRNSHYENDYIVSDFFSSA